MTFRRTRCATKKSSTGYLGVYLRSDTGKYAAQITIDGLCRSLGSFPTAELAYEAYLRAKRAGHEGCTL